jgi:hypothetical protein
MNATAALPIVGVDLAKSVFQLAVADGSWRVVESHRLTRTQFERWFANRVVGLVVMEACGSAQPLSQVTNGPKNPGRSPAGPLQRGVGALLATTPIPGMAAEMCNGKHPYLSTVMLVHHRIGEAIDKGAASERVNGRTRVGKLAKIRNDAMNLCCKQSPQPFDPGFIEQGGLDKLGFRLRVK